MTVFAVILSVKQIQPPKPVSKFDQMPGIFVAFTFFHKKTVCPEEYKSLRSDSN